MTIFVFKCGNSIVNYTQDDSKRRMCPVCGSHLDFKIIWCDDCGQRMLINSRANNKLYCDKCKAEHIKMGGYEYYKLKKKRGSVYRNRKTIPLKIEKEDEIEEEEYYDLYYSPESDLKNPNILHKDDIDYFNVPDAFRKLMGIDRVIENKERYLKYDD